MKEHFKYFKYLIKHKWYVYKACRTYKVGFWQSVIHDWSKFLPSEWFPYVEYFYGAEVCGSEWIDGVSQNQQKEFRQFQFDKAWLHHQHFNPHHWQYWVLREDSGSVKVLEMTRKYMLEMIADWWGAGKAITGEWRALDWYADNKERIQLHPSTRQWVESLLKKGPELGLKE